MTKLLELPSSLSLSLVVTLVSGLLPFAALAQVPSDALDLAIAGSDDHVYIWYGDGTVSSGASWRFDEYRAPRPYSLPPGKKPQDIVAIGIAGSDDHVYVWYADGTVSSGTSWDLDAYRHPSAYSLPPGKKIDQIVAMAIAGSDDKVYAWYSDGTVSSGTSTDLDAHRAPYSYSLASGRTPSNVIGIGIAGSDDHSYAWYRDGTVSSGTTADLDRHRAPYFYQQHLVVKSSWGPGLRAGVFPVSGGVRPGRAKLQRVTSPAKFRLDQVEHEPEILEVGSEVDLSAAAAASASDMSFVGQSPPPIGTPFTPGIEGVDPMVAVGRNYVLVSQQGAVGFFDKNGNPLPEKVAGYGPVVSGNELFAKLLEGGGVGDINHFIRFPRACDDASYPQTAGERFCVTSAYDLRVLFDAGGNRFIVFGNTRNQIWTDSFRKSLGDGEKCGHWKDPSGNQKPIAWSSDPSNWCQLARRYVMLAVSKTEDPRDGFHLYALTENNYRDFPWATINGDSLVIASRGQEMPKGPVASVLSLSALRAGSERPPYFRYYRSDLAGGHTRLLLPVHNGSPDGLTLMYATGAGAIRVFGFPPPEKPYSKPPLTSVLVNVEPMFPAVYRNGLLHFVHHYDTKQSPNATKKRSIRVLRFPIWTTPTGQGLKLEASTNANQGYLYASFGDNGPGDHPQDVVSYEEPALAVTKNGDMVVGFGRFPVATQSTLFPEVRYAVWYHGEAEQRGSRVLKSGQASTSTSPAVQLDYAWATVDPVDDETVWIAHEYHAAGGYKMVVGKVKP